MTEHIIAGIFTGTIWQIIGDTSPFGIFILIILALMSLVSWMIIFYKWREFRAVDKAGLLFSEYFQHSSNIADAAGRAKAASLSPLSRIFISGFEQLTALKELKNEAGKLQSRVVPLNADDFEIIEMTMEKTLTEEISKLERKIVFLAITGSSAPFMGLLGTVVGIMNAFWSIGQRGSASLAVVAPGIAEALLATIVGLGAAIPAVIAFNWANNKLKYINDRAYGFNLEFIARAKKETL
ncbi:MAG: MotA/TolQ/ExbB proton channel family protein [candidate division Zixibacteria bacterium]|nr:MotA/TolQ/ExbB proton channel family protein [candidate division Zixibacteria bacterium]